MTSLEKLKEMSKKAAIAKTQQSILRYANSPKICPTCGKELPYEKRYNKFCNSSCAAKTNNLGVAHNPKKTNTIERKCPNYTVYLDFDRLCEVCCDPLPKNNKKFCSRQCMNQNKNDKWEQEGIVGGSAGDKKIFVINLRGYRCEQCKIETWNDAPVPLVLDHIDGNSENNHESNLRLLCQNCNAQTSTFAGRNKKGNGRFYRRNRYQQGLSF